MLPSSLTSISVVCPRIIDMKHAVKVNFKIAVRSSIRQAPSVITWVTGGVLRARPRVNSRFAVELSNSSAGLADSWPRELAFG